jgi:hypothetical protein
MDLWLIFAVILCGPKSQRLLCKRRVSKFIGTDIFGELEVLDREQF